MHHPPTSPDPAVHSPDILELIELQVTDKLTSYVAETTINVVDAALGYQSTAWNRASSGSRPVAFDRFVWDVIRRASVKMPVLLTTLVYITRAKSLLHIEAEDWACERVFLGDLMVASKYTNDSTLRNVHWALATGVFGRRDVNRVEREFLEVLSWELDLTQEDVLAHYNTITNLYNPTKRLSTVLPSPSQSLTATTTPSINPKTPAPRHGSLRPATTY